MERSKILVVDDEEDVVSFLKGYFSAKSYEIYTALSGKEAIDLIESEPLDLVLLDMKMKGIDGVGVLKNMRRMWSPARVVVITGYPEEYKDAIKEIGGVEAVFSKPIVLKELTERIDRLLSNYKGGVEESLMLTEKTRKILGKEPLPPSKEKIRAKLLFYETVPSVYGVFLAHFNQRRDFNEEYILSWAHTRRRYFSELESFRPDICLLDFTCYYCDEIARETMVSPHRPKEVVVFGPALGEREKKKIEEKGLRAIDVSYFSPACVDSLIQLVRDIALKYNLKCGE